MLALVAVLPLLPLWLLPPPDEGYDFLVLDMPNRAVMGNALGLAVRGRPGVPYLVIGDVGRNTFAWAGNRNLLVHLSLTPAMFVATSGVLPAHGSQPHALGVPVVPTLEGAVLYFQAFGRDQGVIGGYAASDGKSVTFHTEQGQPLLSLLTVNRIPRDQNGAEIDEGTMAVPPTGFTVDLVFDDRGKGAIAPGTLSVTADTPLALGSIPANTNLAQFFTVTPTSATATVDNAWRFPPAATVTLTATIQNQAGVTSPPETVAVRVLLLTASNRPFAVQQLWWVDFNAHDLDGNGTNDFREDLVLFGLGSDPKIEIGPSGTVATWATAQVIAQLKANYGLGGTDPVNIDFFERRPTGTHARICVGGRNPIPANQLPPGAQETTGAAYLNARNQRKNLVDCFGQVGVHSRSVFHLFKNVPAFKLVFDPLMSNPVGLDPDDVVVTAPGFNPSQATARQRVRWTEIQNGLQAFARAVAFILTQETSHSMGLEPDGKLHQGGLLGGYSFGHSTAGHTDDGQGAFMSGNNSTPAPAQPANLALIWDHFQSGRAHFTALNWAYLRERVINQ